MSEYKKSEKGFTLPELLIVMILVGIITASFFKLSDTMVIKGTFNTKEAKVLREVDIFFTSLESDLMHGAQIIPEFMEYSSGPNMLVLKTISTKDKSRQSKMSHSTVIYSVSQNGRLLRREYVTGSRGPSDLYLSYGVKKMEITHPLRLSKRGEFLRLSVLFNDNDSGHAHTNFATRIFRVQG